MAVGGLLFDRLRHGLRLDGHRALALLPGSLVGIAPFLCRGLCGERMDITSKRTLSPAYGMVALPGMLRLHLWLRPIPERGTRHFLGALCGWICRYCAFDDPLPDVEVCAAYFLFGPVFADCAGIPYVLGRPAAVCFFICRRGGAIYLDVCRHCAPHALCSDTAFYPFLPLFYGAERAYSK